MSIFKEMGRTGPLGDYAAAATLMPPDPPELLVEQSVERLRALALSWQSEREQIHAQGAQDAEKAYDWMLERIDNCLDALGKRPSDHSEPAYSTDAISYLRELLTLPDYITQSNRIARPRSELLLTQRRLCASLTFELDEFS